MYAYVRVLRKKLSNVSSDYLASKYCAKSLQPDLHHMLKSTSRHAKHVAYVHLGRKWASSQTWKQTKLVLSAFRYLLAAAHARNM
jgi:hypothetical protein